MKPISLTLCAAAVAFALIGCAPSEPAPPAAESSPSAPSPGSGEASGDPENLVIPENCDALVPIEWVQTNFGPDIVAIPISGDLAGGDIAEFEGRGGLACLWGLPASEFGFVLLVAERATSTDTEQIALWESAGFSLGPDFLDATYYDIVTSELGDDVTIYSLVEGFELRVFGIGTELDPYLMLLREATENMGYV